MAIWSLNLSTLIKPTFAPAVKLPSRLSRLANCGRATSTSRSFRTNDQSEIQLVDVISRNSHWLAENDFTALYLQIAETPHMQSGRPIRNFVLRFQHSGVDRQIAKIACV